MAGKMANRYEHFRCLGTFSRSQGQLKTGERQSCSYVLSLVSAVDALFTRRPELKNQGNDDMNIEVLSGTCDAKIEELIACAKQAGPELKSKMDQEIGEMIANREALRRGLLRTDEEGELCSSCPH
jgi:hypothetical protein